MYIDQSLLNDGITQDERRMAALMPDFIKIDERDISDMLRFATELSAQFNYYNINNKIEGNWEDFFRSDPNILLINISKFDMSNYTNLFSKYRDELYIAENEQELLNGLKNLFNFVVHVFDLLKNLRDRLLTMANSSKMSDELLNIVDSFDDELLKLNRYTQEAATLFGEKLQLSLPHYFIKINTSLSANEAVFTGSSTKERIINALPAIKDIFNEMSKKCNHLLGFTKFYLKNHDLLNQEYAPHLALYIAFLHLYEHLQQKLNLTTKDHLDLYYKRILGLHPNNALPDSVHVVFEKDAVATQVPLTVGEEVVAQMAGQQIPAFFTLNESLLITGAQIAELKTLYLAEHIQVKTDNGTVKEVQVYSGNYPCSTAANFLKNKLPVQTWPVLGEDQDGLAEADKSMDITNIGLMMASPVLYQTEGRRIITFHIYIDDASFSSLIAYFVNYAKVTGKDLAAVSYQLLSDAFVIDYTDTLGWVTIPKYTASLNEDEKRLEFEVQINKAEQVVDVYKPEIHGGNFDTTWPLFRFLLKNYAANNAFTFLRTIKIIRISIAAEVKGSRAVKLQNNVGPLNASSPSQIFGPLPAVGSYLDIKNSNIFNRYTRTFCIRLDWADLPKEPGGWETYYKAYNNNITNGSFRVNISMLNDGKFVPKEELQQDFSLFETDDSGMGILSNTTQLKNIDVKRLDLVKKPLLDKEDTVKDKNFAEGAVRLELISPKDGFGQRLYQIIFPEVVLHNAKKSKKLPLPNPPYIALIRSLTVDYLLEHSETLSAGNAKNADDIDLKVFHVYPFGAKELYPDKRNSPYSLIPDFDQGNNLYIGLIGIKPGQILSLLFQLEENNFTNLAKKTEPVIWSYLDDDNWVYLTGKDVLVDNTNNFINTGIIKIKLPVDLKTGNAILSPQLYWIRASAKGNANVKSKIIGIYPQAVVATRVVSNNPHAAHIPPGAIKTLKNKVIGIQSITQPFQSFGGKKAESDEQFYIRVSERLRHNQKLLTSRDIEQAILDRFPEILLVKCISPQEYTQAYIEEYRPNPRVVLIPKEQVNGLFLSDEPKVNLSIRYQVKKFLEKSVSSFVKIDVENTVYERVKVICTIKFNTDGLTDTGMYIRKFNDDIKRYLCPWLYDGASVFKIGTSIYIGEMLNYLKKLPYIKYITGFSLVHFYYNNAMAEDDKKARIVDYANNNDAYIKGTLPETVLIPSTIHLITVEDDVKHVKAKKSGISELAIMDELLVNKYDKSELIREKEDEGNQANTTKNLFDLIIPHNLD
ncbi:hypothetical protein HDF19_11350 [Mucilaginibacter sp. E4BP6]|uniref:hypothetical protein n=1 Tax=Mucilaginibacter sp. E4BP6 TaxID=2723089 RepID=UPI0015C82D0A|nr:hypothetical protein [Mucilaginibacter sp. E4BP6]NYE65246.1 hypothetical protein [Mucilaginibacter sp. E4BP6]